jgi:hypothetical protein
MHKAAGQGRPGRGIPGQLGLHRDHRAVCPGDGGRALSSILEQSESEMGKASEDRPW